MKRLLLILVLILTLVSTASFAVWPNAKNIEVRSGSMLGWDNASATWRPVKIDQDTGEIGVTAEMTIGSITVEVFPVFADEAGNAATATIDLDNRAIVNVGSETIGLISAINAVAAACASETNLVTAIDAITTALGNPLIVEAELATDSIGLIAAINAVAASPTVWEQQTITLVANTAQTITSEITGTRKSILLKAQAEKPFWVSIDGDAVIGTNGTLVNDWILLDVPLAVNVSVIASEAFAVSVTESGW